jgi:hypothetical protein
MTTAYPWPHELGTASSWEADSNERTENEQAEVEREHADDEESRRALRRSNLLAQSEAEASRAGLRDSARVALGSPEVVG